LIDVHELRVYFDSARGLVKALDGVDFHVGRGEIVGVAGESGCGKTTLALAISRLISSPGKIMGGKIEFEGRDIIEMDEDEFRKSYRWKKIAMVFQGSMNGFTPVFTIGSQIDEVLMIHGYHGNRVDRIAELLGMVELEPGIARRFPHELSGGQKQRAFLAMALAIDPPFLIADEPTTALDVLTQSSIINLLKTLRKKKQISIMLVTHDLALLSEIVDRVYVLYAGKLAEVGTSDAVFERPKHPYTKGLIASVPTITGKSISGISGFMPDLVNLPPGCKFAPRCPNVMTICKNEEPRVQRISEEQKAACWLY